jgi:hypothetical protein
MCAVCRNERGFSIEHRYANDTKQCEQQTLQIAGFGGRIETRTVKKTNLAIEELENHFNERKEKIHSNRRIIERVAITLDELNDDVVYVGGATVSLYVNDPAAKGREEQPRTLTISVEITSIFN